MQTAEGPTTLRAGDLILAQPLVWHAYPIGETFEVIEVLFDAQGLLAAWAPGETPFRPVSDLLKQRPAELDSAIPLPLPLTPACQAAIRQNMLMLYHRQRSQPDGVEPLFQQVRLGIILFDAVQPSSAGDSVCITNPAISRILDCIAEHAFTATPSLRELGKSVGWSAAYLSRQFKSHLGIGPIDYLHSLRIEKACALLTSTDLSISEIAIRTGYQEIPYFNRRFRRRVGVTPTAYRLGRRR